MTTSEVSQKLTLQTQVLLVLFCALAYFYAFKLNVYWFDWIEFSHGVNWIYIPSGLRLLFVLIVARLGGIGVALSSIAVNYSYGNSDAHVFNIVTGVISGASPCIARYLAIQQLNLDALLVNLTARDFLKISVLFALVNALLHQLWYFWMEKTQDFFASTLAMSVGDWFGTVLVLAIASLGIQLFKLLQSHKPEDRGD
jgi:hypothetical protein